MCLSKTRKIQNEKSNLSYPFHFSKPFFVHSTRYHLYVIETTFHLQKPHFSTHIHPLNLILQPPNNETMIFLLAHQNLTSKAHKTLHFISNKTFYSQYGQSAKSSAIFIKKMINTFPSEVFYFT